MEDEQIVTLEKLRDELVRNAFQIRKGELKPIVGNAVANSLKGAVYAEQARIQRDKYKPIEQETTIVELSDESKAKLNEIAELMKKM